MQKYQIPEEKLKSKGKTYFMLKFKDMRVQKQNKV